MPSEEKNRKDYAFRYQLNENVQLTGSQTGSRLLERLSLALGW